MEWTEGNQLHGNAELEAIELGHRATGYVVLVDLYPETAASPESPFFYHSTFAGPDRT